MKIEDINGLIRDKIALQAPVICEDEAKKIFKSFNLPVVEDLKVTSPEEAKEAAKKMRFPVVLKGIGSKILHKTELGMVQLGLATPDQVYDSACKMKEKAKEKLEALLIQPQLKGEREFVAGMFKDDQFGPVIMFGLGGIFTEALNDTVFKIAPLSDADMEDMFDQLASKKLLNDFRGDKAVDKKEMKKILKGLSDLSCQVPHIREIDINPLMITPEGKPVAVDGLIILEPETRRKTKQYDIDKVALGACFYPESIAFVGASSTIGKWGHMLLTNTLSRDFKGRVYLVNPKAKEITGRKVYQSVTDIEDQIDLAVVTIPADKIM
ncbi:MAG: CoA-binding protein, partial [Desulfobacteraceae bacterium]|nr:CoA-binding protein [Desulfobacteraceae bacterium]